MNSRDRAKIQYLGDYLCKRYISLIIPEDPSWGNLRQKQEVRDALECMKYTGLIKDYSFHKGVEQ